MRRSCIFLPWIVGNRPGRYSHLVPAAGRAQSPPVAFYCVADARYFLGAVALVNSLRLVGHDEPVFVLDSGLTPGQRAQLEREVVVLRGPVGQTPHLLKSLAPLRRPADVMILVDTDVIVTRHLGTLVQTAASGRLVAMADRASPRFHPGWGDALRLGRLTGNDRYINAGLLVLPREPGLELLARMDALVGVVDPVQSVIGRGSASDPFYYLDQDVLNALLLVDDRRNQVEVLPHRFAPFPPFAKLRIDDATALRCVYPDGAQPFAIHHIQGKPWLTLTRTSIYSRLLTRLLLADDLPITIDPCELPLRLREGVRASFARFGADAASRLQSQRGRLGLRRHLATRTPEMT
jgi:hypothetical protein